MKRFAIRQVTDDTAIAADLLHRATAYTTKWTEDHGFVYVMGSGTINPGFVQRCPRCGALVMVPHTRDVMTNLADVYAHVAWHDQVEDEPDKLGEPRSPKDFTAYEPPGVYCVAEPADEVNDDR